MNTVTTGTGTITLGTAFSDAFLTDVEASVANAANITFVIEEGSDFEISRGVYTSATRVLTRATVLQSKISGTAGTSKMNLQGSATVRITAVSEDLVLGPSTSTDNAIARFDGATGKTVQNSSATLDDSGTLSIPSGQGIELGHATDTTLTRASAGNVNIEGNIVYRAGGTDVPVADGGTGASTAATAFANISTPPTKQIFTSSGTYTKPTSPSPKFVRITCVGAGGGGGGADGDTSAAGAGGGGGGGATSIKWIAAASVGATETVTIGAGGAGGLAGNNTGSAGGDTSLGAHCVAKGGSGGASTGAAGTTTTVASGGAGGAESTGTGDLKFQGSAGLLAIRFSGTATAPGAGGASMHGGGAPKPGAFDAVGIAGSPFGGGGSGAGATTTTDRAGGAGAAGVVFVEEFY